MLDYNTAPELPLGLGMSLAQSPTAYRTYATLPNARKHALIGYIQNVRDNGQAGLRMNDVVDKLNHADTSFF